MAQISPRVDYRKESLMTVLADPWIFLHVGQVVDHHRISGLVAESLHTHSAVVAAGHVHVIGVLLDRSSGSLNLFPRRV